MRFIKYCIVGASGTVIDLTTLYFLVEFVQLNVFIAVILSFSVSVINNFILNKIWTFNNKSKEYRKQFIKFMIISCGGLLITISLMYFFINIINIWYMFAKVLTTLIVVIWNYLGNKYWTFKTKKQESVVI